LSAFATVIPGATAGQVRLRELTASHSFLAAKLAELEKKVTGARLELRQVIATPRALLQSKPKARRKIGYYLRPSAAYRVIAVSRAAPRIALQDR
jgi:hypothetical protein